MKKVNNVAVIGGGSWATALVKILCDHKQTPDNNLGNIYWWVRHNSLVEYIKQNHHNPDYLSSIEIHPDLVTVDSNLKEIVKNADIIIIVIPAAFAEESLKSLNKNDFENKFVVSAIKGLIPSTRQIVGDYLIDKYNIPEKRIGVISGPCHAEEVANEKLSYLTIASEDQDFARKVAEYLSCRYVKTVVSNDVRGTEYGAVLKNIYAVAAGICHGLGYGDNFQAVLMSNALREMKRFLRNITDANRKINHSAYLGDLLVTAYSIHSRNRTFGNMIGLGYTVQNAQLEMKMVAEGYYATKNMYILNQQMDVKMPILNAVYDILYNNKPAKKVIEKLTEKLV
ncbi:MAG: NAD(P)H-dependent glycerol-3-phosphate dehydrogenase [Bacteroidia bacterium]